MNRKNKGRSTHTSQKMERKSQRSRKRKESFEDQITEIASKNGDNVVFPVKCSYANEDMNSPNKGRSAQTSKKIMQISKRERNRRYPIQDEVQSKQNLQSMFSEEERERSSVQTSELPTYKHIKKRPRGRSAGLQDEQTFTDGKGKKIRTSDYSPFQNSKIKAQKEAEANSEENEDKPSLVLKLNFKPENMNKFFKADPESFDEMDDQNSTLMIDQPFDVHTSWEGCAKKEIENLARRSGEDFNIKFNTQSAPIEIADFFYYAQIVYCLVLVLKQDRQDILFMVGEITVLLRSSDLYCCPVSQDEKKLDFSDKMLNYAKLKLSDYVKNNFSMILWNYMTGNHKKMRSYIKTAQDAIAICAVLFSEVIRYPNMFFHNILMTQHFKTWDEFCDFHPMIKGGTWKCQGENRDISQNLQQGENVPEKVKQSEKETLKICVRKMIGDKDKRNTPFQLNQVKENLCEICICIYTQT